MSVGHYENFPVASILLPPPLRRPVAVIYRFARSADDFADEGELPAAERLALIENYRGELQRIAAGRAPGAPFFEELRAVIAEHHLPIEPFYDLLDAFAQDVTKKRYASFAEVADYCRRSADPIGRLMLRLYGQSCNADYGDRHIVWSDSICSGLQLVNFWQDVELDWAKGRVYLPQDEMARFGVAERQIAARDAGGSWAALMQFQVERARAMLERGAPLALALPGRIGLEIRTVVEGGLRILQKIEHVSGDVFRHRPVLRAWDWPLMLARALMT